MEGMGQGGKEHRDGNRKGKKKKTVSKKTFGSLKGKWKKGRKKSNVRRREGEATEVRPVEELICRN